MKKKTERQLIDVKPISAVTRAADESVDKITYTNILKTSILNNGGFFHRREYLTKKLNFHVKGRSRCFSAIMNYSIIIIRGDYI